VIAGMCLWVPAPGRTATLFAPDLSDFPQAAAATQQAVAAALTDARDAGIVLVQALVEPADAAGRAVFSATGLALLATLTYMERLPPPALLHTTPPDCTLPTDLTLTPYTPATHTLFREAILRSYEGTLDCPALSNMRDIDDVIEGHKAVGLFDPQLWGVLLRDGKPLGCLLLAEIPARQGLELVYLAWCPKPAPRSRTFAHAACAGHRRAPAFRSGDAGGGRRQPTGIAAVPALRLHKHGPARGAGEAADLARQRARRAPGAGRARGHKPWWCAP